MKKVKHLIPAFDINMGGLLLKQALPTTKIEQVDPFLLLHHAGVKMKNNRKAIHLGVGPHPHRGFSPVTFVIEGEVHHRDSRGNNQIAKQGEVQWMHAGAGIIHSERPSQDLVEREGRQEIIQLWINSPASKKMNPPQYQYIPEAEIPIFTSEDGQVRNKLIAGNYGDLTGKITTESELLVIWSDSSTIGKQVLYIPDGFNTMLYVIKGQLKISGYGFIEKKTLAVFGEEGNAIEVSLEANTQFLLLAGVPLNEKVAQQGPFVMNSETEILQAMRDYQMGKMGVLIEE